MVINTAKLHEQMILCRLLNFLAVNFSRCCYDVQTGPLQGDGCVIHCKPCDLLLLHSDQGEIQPARPKRMAAGIAVHGYRVRHNVGHILGNQIRTWRFYYNKKATDFTLSVSLLSAYWPVSNLDEQIFTFLHPLFTLSKGINHAVKKNNECIWQVWSKRFS